MGGWQLGVISAIGLMLNAYIVIIVILTRQTRTPASAATPATTVLLVHLGAVEIILCLVILIASSTNGVPCVLHGFVLALLHPVALWTVTGLNCDRYCAIAAPLHYAGLVSTKRVAFALVTAWSGILLLCLPPLCGLAPPYRYDPGLGWCVPDLGAVGWGMEATWYAVTYTSLGLALPAALVTACNLRVLRIARYHRHRIASAIYQVTLSAQVTITHQRNPFSLMPATWMQGNAGGPPRLRSPATCTVVQLLGSLYTMYLPYCVLIAWKVCTGQQSLPEPPAEVETFAATLLACSAPVNGLLYGLKSRALRHSVRNYFRKKATESELHQEIQARVPSVTGSRRPSMSTATTHFPMLLAHRCLSEVLLPSDEQQRPAALRTATSCNTLGIPSIRANISGEGRQLGDSMARTESGVPLLRDQDQGLPLSDPSDQPDERSPEET
ncbi:probable G-protein coupled receptor 21 [Neodiprion pinetum]|uniref:G-protein coupled receptor 161-like n=1 Tax=Neodiprion lecontei TaxID=441921 RepID=A0A6J0BDI0_NEOLC|nr:G-protein coupled receptor 161-like [Neodiprion lecontei]XP_046481188.1 G-protein coupled receptor 161-like [Neodiprion pinetum]